MTVRCSEHAVDGIAALEIDNADLRAMVLPQVGAKILSLVDLRTGRNLLFRSRRPLIQPEYGGRYDRYDYSGWDECFPGIGECPHPEYPWAGVTVPDHGELWTLPWQTELIAGVLRQYTHGVRFPYTFERRIDFNGGDRLVFSYFVENHAPYPFKAFWSTHPMLAVTPTTRILLPPGVQVRVEVSKNERIGGYLSERPWPRTRDRWGREIDLDVIGLPEQRTVEKLFSTDVPAGWCALYDEASEEFLAFTFRPEQVPFVGVAAMRGGWPTESASDLIVVLEPCTGWPDRLDIAITRGAAVAVPPQGRIEWQFDATIGRGRGRLDEIIRNAPRR